MIKPGEPVHIVPYVLLIRMKNMGPVPVYLNARYFFRKNISRYMISAVNDKTSGPLRSFLLCKNRPV